MQKKQHFIIDFDSTFTKVEALDVLCDIAMNGNPEKEKVLQEIKDITDKGMNGEMSFDESLEKRIELLDAKKEHMPRLIEALSQQVSDSFVRNKEFVKKYADRIIILSNGFKDFIDPIVESYGISSEKVYANEFIYDDEGHIIDFDRSKILSKNNGKPEQIKKLNLDGEIFVLGDGYTDYEIKKAGIAHKFYAFTENVRRQKVLDHADHEAPNLDDFLYTHKLDRALSYPKNRIKILVLENIHTNAFDRLKDAGFSVKYHTSALSEEELIKAIEDVSILCIRSKTNVTAKVLEHANRLMAVGAFCIGTNQIDLETCTEKGIAVFNAPFSNTRSVVELAIAEMIMLMRKIPDKTMGMHRGKWEKSAVQSQEIRGKTLGIVGYGNIGAQLSVLAEGIGMQVRYYDVEEKLALGNAQSVGSLHELLEQSDVVTLHVDGRPENKNLIGKAEFDKMRPGTVFLNLSRGHVVEIDALQEAIESGKVKGAGVDVFPKEPKSNDSPFESELIGSKNTILTPHVGGSTEEAQENIAEFVPNKLITYINSGSTANSVNFPNLTLPAFKNAHRFIHIHKNEPGVLAKINQTLANFDINVIGQHLKTNEVIGYVITDIDKEYEQEIKKELKKITGTLRFRVLY